MNDIRRMQRCSLPIWLGISLVYIMQTAECAAYLPQSNNVDQRAPYTVTTAKRFGTQEIPGREEPIIRPNPGQRIFFSRDTCLKQCLVDCQPMYAENDNTLHVCPRLKPAEKSLHERLMAEASWPWLLFLFVLGASLLFCVLCVCWSCCCREGGMCAWSPTSSGRHSNSSHEPLATDRRIEEIINEHPSCPNNRLTGSKYVVDV
ncbi:hypothetical protein Ddc_03369 [Ditylenchus destructor]|nr:hypothetical protein Ddc_03369 [Ditylenchus destructor]